MLVHGHATNFAPSGEYKTWENMIQRCTNPKATGYRYYGGRGITVCERWRKFQNFIEDVGLRPKVNMSLDRIDPDGNYEPNNCRWATYQQQRDNQKGGGAPRKTHCIRGHLLPEMPVGTPRRCFKCSNVRYHEKRAAITLYQHTNPTP